MNGAGIGSAPIRLPRSPTRLVPIKARAVMRGLSFGAYPWDVRCAQRMWRMDGDARFADPTIRPALSVEAVKAALARKGAG
jgi:hypothetical protein